MDTDLLAATLAEQVDPQRITQLTLDMVRIPSPPGQERAVSEFYARELREIGLDVELDEEFRDSPSVVARLKGRGGAPTLQLDGHTDTIDLPGPPPRFEDGYIHGRGSEDMKASLAAMAEAARIVCAAGIQLEGELLLTAHGRHESATNETLISLIGKGVHGDAVIVTELGGDNLPIAGMGLAFWEIRIKGDDEGIHETVAAPGAPHPVMAGYRTVQLLQEKAAELARERLPYLGSESIFVGRFQGGDYFNRLPASCVIAGTRRFGPQGSMEEIRREFDQLAARVAGESGAQVDVWLDGVEGYQVDENERLARVLRQAHLQVTGQELPLAGTLENGALQMIARSHKLGMVPHECLDNLQTDDVLAKEVTVPVKAGGCIFLHSLSLHATAANRTPDRRRAHAMRYIPSASKCLVDLSQLPGYRADILLVQGQESTVPYAV